jgi:hypothetical protein
MDPSTFDPTTFDLGIILTAAGAVVAAGIVAAVIQLAERIPVFGKWLDAERESFAAVLLSGVLVAYAFAATAVPLTLVSGFMAFLAWINIAGLASKAYDVAPAGLKTALGGS